MLPDEKTIEEVTVCTTSVCAVIVLLTSKLEAVAFCLIKKLSAEEAVAANEADTAFSTYEAVVAFCAQDAVPNKEPVILVAVKGPVIVELPLMLNEPVTV